MRNGITNDAGVNPFPSFNWGADYDILHTVLNDWGFAVRWFLAVMGRRSLFGYRSNYRNPDHSTSYAMALNLIGGDAAERLLGQE